VSDFPELYGMLAKIASAFLDGNATKGAEVSKKSPIVLSTSGMALPSISTSGFEGSV